jgi:capsid protein
MAWHWFTKSRGAAQRGMTNLVTILKSALHLDKFDDAQLQLAIIQSVMAPQLKTGKSHDTAREILNTAPTTGSVVAGGMTFADKGAFYKASGGVKVAQNQVTILAPEDELTLEVANVAAQSFSGFRDNILRPMASALGITTEMITKDYTQANYSSIRAALVDSMVDLMAERGLFTDHVPKLIADAVTEEMWAKGWLDLWPGLDFYEYREAYTACDFVGPGVGWVDPMKEALAAAVRVATGLSSLKREALIATGADIEDIAEERRDELALFKKYDVPLGSPQTAAAELGVDMSAVADQSTDEPPARKAIRRGNQIGA